MRTWAFTGRMNDCCSLDGKIDVVNVVRPIVAFTLTEPKPLFDSEQSSSISSVMSNGSVTKCHEVPLPPLQIHSGSSNSNVLTMCRSARGVERFHHGHVEGGDAHGEMLVGSVLFLGV